MKLSEKANAANAAQEVSDLLPVPVKNSGGASLYLDSNRFNQAYKAARLLAQAGEMVPKHFQGSWEKCFVALELADRFGMSPFAVMQRVYVVHGRPGMEAKLKIALANQRAPIKGCINYDIEQADDGRILGCTAYVILKDTGDRAEMTVTREMVEAEGWHKPKPKWSWRDGKKFRDGEIQSKWVTMPELMYRYRSASMLIDTHFPDVVMGIRTVEEIEDIEVSELESTPAEPPPEPVVEHVDAVVVPDEPVDEKPESGQVEIATTPVENNTKDDAESRKKKFSEALAWADDWGVPQSEVDIVVKSLDIKPNDARTMTPDRLAELSGKIGELADNYAGPPKG